MIDENKSGLLVKDYSLDTSFFPMPPGGISEGNENLLIEPAPSMDYRMLVLIGKVIAVAAIFVSLIGTSTMIWGAAGTVILTNSITSTVMTGALKGAAIGMGLSAGTAMINAFATNMFSVTSRNDKDLWEFLKNQARATTSLMMIGAFIGLNATLGGHLFKRL